MKTIKITGTSVEINVNTAEEMHMIFFRLHGWNELEVDGDIYPVDPYTGYTISYFKAKYF